jgi:hypothetical protein
VFPTQHFDPEDGGRMFLWNIGKHPPDYMASQSPLWEPQGSHSHTYSRLRHAWPQGGTAVAAALHIPSCNTDQVYTRL